MFDQQCNVWLKHLQFIIDKDLGKHDWSYLLKPESKTNANANCVPPVAVTPSCMPSYYLSGDLKATIWHMIKGVEHA